MENDTLGHDGDRIVGDLGDEVVCPMPCSACSDVGDCEDCLDCLYWPEVVRAPPPTTSPRGPTAPTRTGELVTARAALDIGQRVGLVTRRHRGSRQLSQRALAAELGWHHSTLTRAETNAFPLALRKAEDLLQHIGYRLAVVPARRGRAAALDEDPDEVWGTGDLLARDAQGRRLPPYGRLTWSSTLDRVMYARILGHEAEWTWRRSHDHPDAPFAAGSWVSLPGVRPGAAGPPADTPTRRRPHPPGHRTGCP